MFNDLSSPAALMQTRRSGKPRDMAAPGPSSDQLDRILGAAIRVPDHGKLAPWRFVIVPDTRREDFATLLEQAYRLDRPATGAAEMETVRQFAFQAPTLVVALSAPAHASQIPIWEQELSVGAACMAMLVATHAEGFVGGWLTGWAAYSDAVRDAFGQPGERIAGFMFIGSPTRPLDERPRPERNSVISTWSPA
ncbi:nitroreductase family protein [Sphingomonas nostoxanthinifaciens]|uniref:nitroreductase family protein n=1 Tax=Sphingomonas nostoxanthinifaciens TaxID=2872652 RepID=UPI001CC1E9DE|nr:nitroreductase [Sphingomonas nostoxanthinifaciens]UAK23360.1 nitroreductase [Sphingomonas nostoxanthinifaciens]